MSRYIKAGGILASRRHRGRKPIWGRAILRRYVRPVAQQVGIQKRFRWHTFRHTYSTLLRSVGTKFKGDAGVTAAFLVAIYARCLHPKRSRPQNMRRKQPPSRWYWPSEAKLHRTRVRVVKPVQAELVKMALIHEKGCKNGAKTCPLHPRWFQRNRDNSFVSGLRHR